jgi:hypothetical protein
LIFSNLSERFISRFHSVGKKVIKNALNLRSVSIISGTYYFD